ncbi:MAG: HAMP domain-containing sensor histidine kinase [Actinomycetota bacterium]
MAWQRLNTLRNRLVLLFFVITGAAVGFVYLYVVPQLESSLTTEKLTRLEERGSVQRTRLERAMRSGLSEQRLGALLRRVSQATDSRVTILGVRELEGGRAAAFVVSDSQPETTPVTARYDIAAPAVRGRTGAGVESVGGARTAEVAIPIPESDPQWIAIFSEPLGEVSDNVALIRRQILIAGGIAMALALLAGFWAAGAISRRIGRLEQAAEKVAGGDFATPIPVDSSDELGQLARTFNEMQQRLAELDSARKQFIANASHELRTPIFSIGGFVELLDEEDPDPAARAEFVRTMREQVERLTKLTTDLLDLSKLDAGAMELAPRRVDLGQLARDAAREFGPLADRHKARLEVRGPKVAAVAEADTGRVRQIIRILLDNALTHTPEGTKVTVTTLQEGGRAELIVSDEGGPGVGPRSQARMFDRFYTGDSASGSGLGLAIARELAVRMDGRLDVVSSKGFTAFILSLPPGAQRKAAREDPDAAASGATA